MYSLLGVGGHLSDEMGEYLYLAFRSAENLEMASIAGAADGVGGALPEIKPFCHYLHASTLHSTYGSCPPVVLPLG